MGDGGVSAIHIPCDFEWGVPVLKHSWIFFNHCEELLCRDFGGLHPVFWFRLAFGSNRKKEHLLLFSRVGR